MYGLAYCAHVGWLCVQDESGTVYDEAGVAEDMLQFLTEFRDAHQLYFTAPLFITGESYGGVSQVTCGPMPASLDVTSLGLLKLTQIYANLL